MKNGLIEFLIRYEEMVIIRNEFNKINIVDIFFEMVRFFFYLIFLKCIYSFFFIMEKEEYVIFLLFYIDYYNFLFICV